MPLPSWKDVMGAFDLDKNDWRSEDLKAFLIAYVNDHMDVAILSSDHSEIFYQELISEAADRYPFILTSEDYPEDPTPHEKVICGFAMRLHNVNRASHSKARRQTKKMKSCSPSSRDGDNAATSVASGKRKDRGMSVDTTSSKKRRREGDSVFLEKVKMHGSVTSTFCAKLVLMLNGEEKVDPQSEALKDKSFGQIGVFVQDVAESAKPFETRWQAFVANEMIWEHVKGF